MQARGTLLVAREIGFSQQAARSKRFGTRIAPHLLPAVFCDIDEGCGSAQPLRDTGR